MKKFNRFIVLVILFCSTEIFAATPFDKFVGCYLTKEINGVPVGSNYSPFGPGKIVISSHPAYVELSGKTIPSIDLSFFEGKKADGGYYYGGMEAFTDRGEFSTAGTTASYSFKGDVRYVYSEQPSDIFSIDERIVVKQPNTAQIYVDFVVAMKLNGYYFPGYSKKFLLEKMTCLN